MYVWLAGWLREETAYTCNDSVALIVEDTGEDLVRVPLQDL